MRRKVFKAYGTTCMVVCYNIRPLSLAVHRCETTAVMYRIGVVRTAGLALVVSPTIQDETRQGSVLAKA
jgi:hypothetical protein